MSMKTLFLVVISVFIGGYGAPPFPCPSAAAQVLENPRMINPPAPPSLPYCLITSDSEKEDQEAVEEQVQKLLEQMKQLEKDLEKKMQREILPAIRKEIEKLKQWLEQYRKEPKEEKPRWTNRNEDHYYFVA